MKTCMLTGHYSKNLPFPLNENNKSYEELKRHLDFLIREKIRNGITHFIAGMTFGTVYYAIEIVLYLRDEYPNITLDLILPHAYQSRKFSNNQLSKYDKVLNQCDNILVLQDTVNPYCIQKLNQYLVEHSDIAIAIWDGTNKGISKIVKYALSKKLPITVIHPSTFTVQNL